jgi:hypothetical protein
VPIHHADRTYNTANRKPVPLLFFAGLALAMVMLVPAGNLMAQDTTGVRVKVQKPHSIRRAALYSAALPGLGQVYNRKAWKVPIIYAGFGVLGYFIATNNNEYQLYKEAYVYTANGDSSFIDNPYVGRYNQDQLQRGMDYYRRNRDLSIIITSLWYVLNILEAYVDAHFFDYDISEDLSLKVSPAALPTFARRTDVVPGLKISLNF